MKSCDFCSEPEIIGNPSTYLSRIQFPTGEEFNICQDCFDEAINQNDEQDFESSPWSDANLN